MVVVLVTLIEFEIIT